MSKVVVVDPGHGGSDPGACANGLKEKDLVLSISKFCKEYLESKGIKVFQTRESDKSISISERAAFANRQKAALFVSIHTNAGGGDGVEVIYSVTGGTSLKMAQEVVGSINLVTGQNKRPREIYTRVNDKGHDYFGVIRETNMPAIICECAFIDSKDVEIIDTSQERKLMGIAIAKGILNTLGMHDKEDDEYKAAAKYLHQEGVINTLSVWEDPKGVKLENVSSLLIKCAKRIKELKE